MDRRSTTSQLAAIVVVWATLVGASSLFCAWGVRELVVASRSERSYTVEYTDSEGRTHRLRSSSPDDLVYMLRAMEARFPR